MQFRFDQITEDASITLHDLTVSATIHGATHGIIYESEADALVAYTQVRDSFIRICENEHLLAYVKELWLSVKPSILPKDKPRRSKMLGLPVATALFDDAITDTMNNPTDD